MDLKSDEEFFEELAKQTKPAEFMDTNEPNVQMGGWQVGLARATTTPVRKPAPTVRHAHKTPSINSESEGQLTIDVYQSPSEIVVESAIAGVSPEDLDIDVTTDSVTIRGERQREREISESDYIYRECYWGKFSRSIILPEEIDPENATVEFRNGVLSVHLPKLNRQKAKKLRIKLE